MQQNLVCVTFLVIFFYLMFNQTYRVASSSSELCSTIWSCMYILYRRFENGSASMHLWVCDEGHLFWVVWQ